MKAPTALDYILAVFVGNIVPMIFTATASYLAIHQLSGWGWFLFSAIITVSLPRVNKENEES